MPVPRHREIKIGNPVSIVLKADQRTGRQVQGTVAQLLTRGDHPHGVKVRLTDGRIGRVQQLASTLTPSNPPPVQPRTLRMSSNQQNPWDSTPSQGNPYTSDQQQQYQPQGYQSQNQEQYNPPPQPPPGHQHQQNTSTTTNTGHRPPQPRYAGGPFTHPNAGPILNELPGSVPPPQTPPPRQPGGDGGGLSRSDTDTILAQEGADRAEQIEHLQNFEASAPQTEDDRNQAQLQREFPGVDSSLIAALYGDTGDLGATREMLQELARE